MEENNRILPIEIAEEIAKRLDKKLVVKDVSFDFLINEVKSGKADFFTLWALKEAYIKAATETLKMSEISFVENGIITDKYTLGQIDNYKWAIITL